MVVGRGVLLNQTTTVIQQITVSGSSGKPLFSLVSVKRRGYIDPKGVTHLPQVVAIVPRKGRLFRNATSGTHFYINKESKTPVIILTSHAFDYLESSGSASIRSAQGGEGVQKYENLTTDEPNAFIATGAHYNSSLLCKSFTSPLWYFVNVLGDDNHPRDYMLGAGVVKINPTDGFIIGFVRKQLRDKGYATGMFDGSAVEPALPSVSGGLKQLRMNHLKEEKHEGKKPSISQCHCLSI
ncbi:unnamed protein product [Eruca vesicaria subsp. sativa]|uniref:Uncharacterized protein n=1 Tax=Eruca vesicaria subsp. sativa TaxID=29727 RepID=A0ABC8KL58_ERUVS|nr:unnamed protein product [Eruca vesicaria subsp. sativa]